MDVSNTTVNNWVRAIACLAWIKSTEFVVLKITRSDLLEEKDPLRAVTPVAAKKIPVLGRVAAGFLYMRLRKLLTMKKSPSRLLKPVNILVFKSKVIA